MVGEWGGGGGVERQEIAVRDKPRLFGQSLPKQSRWKGAGRRKGNEKRTAKAVLINVLPSPDSGCRPSLSEGGWVGKSRISKVREGGRR